MVKAIRHEKMIRRIVLLISLLDRSVKCKKNIKAQYNQIVTIRKRIVTILQKQIYAAVLASQ